MSDGSDDVGVSEERIAELEERIEELSGELRSPPEGPFGLPRPPTPGEVLRFVDDHAIPTTIAILEANVRALKALRGAISLLRRTEERDPTGTAEGLRDRTDSVAREAVTELDRAVSDLADAIEGNGMPDDEEARSVLREIRSVRDEVADALTSDDTTIETAGNTEGSSAEGDADESAPDDGGDGGAGGDEDSSGGGVEIDVENELESIKDEMRGETPPGGGSTENGDGSAGNGDGSDGESDG
ncbi:MAG: hypothetical protein ABEH88_00560 [Halobacteriales archaeon]